MKSISRPIFLVWLSLAAPSLANSGWNPAAAPYRAGSDAAPKEVAEGDWRSIRAAHDAWKHSFKPADGGGHTAYTPGQQWRSAFDARGFLTSPDGGGWTWGLQLLGYGFDGNEQRVADWAAEPPVSVEQQRLTRRWDALLEEWYVNDRRGLEHGFTVHRRPRGAGGPLRIEMDVRGTLLPRVEPNGQSVRFEDASGGVALTYGGLKVWDADGQILTASMETTPAGHLRFDIEESRARYPITIDPIAQAAYLKAGNNGPDSADGFGSSVAIHADTVVVGATGEDSSSTGVNSTPDESAAGAGAAYVFVRNAGVWSQQAYLKPAAIGTTQVSDRFGTSVSVNGDTVVVGAPSEGSGSTGVNSAPDEGAPGAGAAYVFVRDAGVWSQQAYLKPAAVGTSQSGDFFGTSVAVSGDTVVVGAQHEDSGSTGVNSMPDESASSAGAAYVFVRNEGVWSQQAYLKPAAVGPTQTSDFFGVSVAVSGETVVVGAEREDSGGTGVNSTPNENASNSGAVYVFVRNAGVWSQEAYLKPAAVGTTQVSDAFGLSVAISGDTVVVGAKYENSSSTGVNSTPNESASTAGAAYVFVRNAGTWSQQAYLKPSAVGTTQSGDWFGTSVAVSGDTVVVGAEHEDSGSTGVNSMPNESASNSGAAYVFVRNGGTWSQQAYLKPAAVGTTQASDSFGAAVAVDGNTVVAGASGEDTRGTGVNSTLNESASNSGAADGFVRVGTTWTQEAFFKASNTEMDPGPAGPGNYDGFGTSVAISGDTAVVGAPREASGSTGVNSTPDEDAPGAGAAYVFVRNGGVWSQEAYLKPAAVGTSQLSDAFGTSVAVYGDTVVVGAEREDSGSTGVNSTPNESASLAGAAYVFVRNAGMWNQQAYLKPSAVGTTQAGDLFGKSVSVHGDTVVVGATGEDSATTGVNTTPNESAFGAGAAYVFVRNAGVWSPQAYLKPAAVGTTQTSDSFGAAVAVHGDTLIVGSNNEDSSSTGVNSTPNEGASGAGAAYVFVRNAGAWSQEAYLKPAAVGTTQVDDSFGVSVAVHGGTAVVGATGEDSSTTGVNSTPNHGASAAGAAYVFVRNAGVWSQEAYLKPSAVGTTQASDFFGTSVAVYGDTVVVGAEGEDGGGTGVNSTPDEGASGAGAAYVFARNAGVWIQEAYLKPSAVGITQASDAYGTSVAIWKDRILIGAPMEDSATRGSGTTPDERALNAGAAYMLLLDLPVDHITDSDGDGLNDTAELALAALGFHWWIGEPSQVSTLFENIHLARPNLNAEGYYTADQIQTLNLPALLLQRNSSTGVFTLTLGLEKSVFPPPGAFVPFPFTTPQTTVNGQGKIEFQFTVPDDAAFFRLHAE